MTGGAEAPPDAVAISTEQPVLVSVHADRIVITKRVTVGKNLKGSGREVNRSLTTPSIRIPARAGSNPSRLELKQTRARDGPAPFPCALCFLADRYGSETVVPSPDAEITKVPAAVLPAYTYGVDHPDGGAGIDAMNG